MTIGIVVAAVLAVLLLSGGATYAAFHHGPSRLDLVTRCLAEEKGMLVNGEPAWDAVASSASSGAIAANIETNPVTIALAGSDGEVQRLQSDYLTLGIPAPRLTERARLVAVWEREPSPTQLQTLYDCTY